jgi:hypothetical protein
MAHILPRSVGCCFINNFIREFHISSHFQRKSVFHHTRTVCPGSRTCFRPIRILSHSEADTSVLADPEPVHVFLFITIVGWGKNSLLDKMLADKRIMQEVFGDVVPTILESDVIGANRFWGEVSHSFRSRNHLFYSIQLKNSWWRTR